MKHIQNRRAWAGSCLIAAALAAGLAAGAAVGHEKEHYSAGEPGDAKKPARTVLITMLERDGKMIFLPDRIDVRKGEQIRFVLRNAGDTDHEFLLATTDENVKHAEEMRKNPDMEHDEANGKRLKPKTTADLIWRFTNAGRFEYGCLIPGHREAGMIGIVVVK